MSPAGSWKPEQPPPRSCKVRDCYITFAGGQRHFLVQRDRDLGYYDNYVYRCGDGGLWMMGALDSEVIGNHRASPYTDPAEVTKHGTNNPSGSGDLE